MLKLLEKLFVYSQLFIVLKDQFLILMLLLVTSEKLNTFIKDLLLDSNLHISIHKINSFEFPIDVGNIYKQLIKEGIIKFHWQH